MPGLNNFSTVEGTKSSYLSMINTMGRFVKDIENGLGQPEKVFTIRGKNKEFYIIETKILTKEEIEAIFDWLAVNQQ